MDWLIEIGKQVPALITLVVLVNWFLKHLKSEREMLTALMDQVTKRDDALMEDQTALTKSVSEALGRAMGLLERMESRLDRDH